MKVLLANFTKMVNDSGGLAKVTSAFANEMAGRGHEVSVVYSDERRGEFFYPVDKRVRLYNLNEAAWGMIRFPLYLKVVREAVRGVSKRQARTVNSWFQEHYLLDSVKNALSAIKPDIIISYQPAASKLLLCDAKTDISVVTMSHGDPEDYFHTYPVREIPALEKSAVCQVLMPSFEEHIKKHLPKVRTITIGNAIPQFAYSADLDAEKEQYKLIFVGRLTKNHKRPHLLVEAFSKLADKYPNWIVELWGARDRATYYKELEHLIKAANLEERVFIEGVTDEVPQKLRAADIFVFPSAYEGFGMALAEGMSIGLPAVGYKSCSAVNELIKDGTTGLLCDDGVQPLAEALDKLMGDKELRIKMGRAAKAEMAQYASQRIWDQWEELMEKVAGK